MSRDIRQIPFPYILISDKLQQNSVTSVKCKYPILAVRTQVQDTAQWPSLLSVIWQSETSNVSAIAFPPVIPRQKSCARSRSRPPQGRCIIFKSCCVSVSYFSAKYFCENTPLSLPRFPPPSFFLSFFFFHSFFPSFFSLFSSVIAQHRDLICNNVSSIAH